MDLEVPSDALVPLEALKQEEAVKYGVEAEWIALKTPKPLKVAKKAKKKVSKKPAVQADAKDAAQPIVSK